MGRDPPPASGGRSTKKEIARRLQLDVKTVRRAADAAGAGVAAEGRQLGPVAGPDRATAARRPEVDREAEPRLLLPLAGAVSPRTVRRYVAVLRRSVTSKEAFVHRSVAPGTTMEVDYGESQGDCQRSRIPEGYDQSGHAVQEFASVNIDIAGVPCKVKYVVATLLYSNAYIAKAYPVEGLESLLDGIESAFRYWGGIVKRVVLDAHVPGTLFTRKFHRGVNLAGPRDWQRQ